MQIVIKISKEDYERLKEYEKAPFYSLTSRVYEAIANGTPLPEGHGRLVDADYLRDVALLHNWHGNDKNYVPYSDRKGYRLREREVDEAILNAPTIIEADKTMRREDDDNRESNGLEK